MTDGPSSALGVDLDAVTKRFGATVAVDGVTLSIPAGSFYSLLGPSGCGKTTTLRLIAGFDETSSGHVRIGGQTITSVPPWQRPVNTVFQNYALFPHMDVFENVAFGLRRKQVPRAELKQRVGDALSLVSLAGYDRRRPSQLSGGQQQRVALARALVNRPSVLLLDEPMAALDPKLRKGMQTELKRLQREVGITFVMVTHDQEEALTMSDCIAVMNGGRVEQVGTPHQVYQTPATRFVADFIGLASFLAGQVATVSGTRVTVALTAEATVDVESTEGTVGAPVELVLRPEMLTVGRDAAHPNQVPAKVVDVVYLGPTFHYHVALKDGTRVVASQATAPLERGDRCVLSWPIAAGRLLAGDYSGGGGAG